jgi:leucyl/phenylalanyl-tRNA--protein transferase
VGGLYGLSLGGAFFGESMFAAEPDASKVAFTVLLGHLAHWGFDFVDCQTRTDHLERFGAIPVARESFLDTLRTALAQPTRMGPWRFELPPAEALAKLSG